MKKIEYLAFGFSVGSQCGVVAKCLGSLKEQDFQKCHLSGHDQDQLHPDSDQHLDMDGKNCHFVHQDHTQCKL